MDYDVRLKSGQVLEISEGGDLNGLPVFTFHGTPGWIYPPHVENAGHFSIFVDKIPKVHAWLSSNF